MKSLKEFRTEPKHRWVQERLGVKQQQRMGRRTFCRRSFGSSRDSGIASLGHPSNPKSSDVSIEGREERRILSSLSHSLHFLFNLLELVFSPELSVTVDCHLWPLFSVSLSRVVLVKQQSVLFTVIKKRHRMKTAKC